MAADAHGMEGDLPASGLIPAQRRSTESTFVAPVTLGRPLWRRRFDRARLATHAATVSSGPGLYLLWQHVVPHPLVLTVLTVASLLLVAHWALHGWMVRLRRSGRAMSTVLAVGSVEAVAALVARTRRAPGLGWRIVGACTPTGAGPDGAATIDGCPVLGDLDGVAALALRQQVNAVAVAPAPGWTAVRLQHLARDLDHSHTALLVDKHFAAGLGPYATTGPVKGLPLLWLACPRLRGVRRIVKGTTDRVVALLMLVLLAPVLLGCVLAVRRDGGPAFCREARVGQNGRVVSLLSFRITAVDTGAVTRVGRVLSRWCLDELPQLLNVLGGSLALVGPRPPLVAEVARGTRYGYGRLPVKPGMTGLWQIAGDDEFSWERAASLNLQYVATWTPLLDARILLTTIGVALRAGAVR